MEKHAYSISEFIEAYSISRSGLYKLWQDGKGPRYVKVGRKVLIPANAARNWANALPSFEPNSCAGTRDKAQR